MSSTTSPCCSRCSSCRRRRWCSACRCGTCATAGISRASTTCCSWRRFWAPDTYDGSPVPVAAFLSTASKAAGFAGLLQLMFIAFAPNSDFWAPLFAVLSIATMTIGNLVALQQRQVVRLFAYSSIAQAGYMLLPFALVGASHAIDAKAFQAVELYILIYGVMNLGAFAVVTAVARESPRLLVEDFAGLVRRAPVIAVAMTLFLISLAGIPPT